MPPLLETKVILTSKRHHFNGQKVCFVRFGYF